MQEWNLTDILQAVHEDVHRRLAEGRGALKNPVTKGTASERTWLKMLRRYLPKRYRVSSAHVVDSHGNFSKQIDAVIFDRQYSPSIFSFEDQLIIPAESIYAAFEIKQDVSLENIRDAQNKIASVRSLHRTSVSVVHAGGTHKPKQPFSIIGGILTLESKWNSDSLESRLKSALQYHDDKKMCLDIGCIAAGGYFLFEDDGGYRFDGGTMSATAFLFSLISLLQQKGTVPAIDIDAYAEWLGRSS